MKKNLFFPLMIIVGFLTSNVISAFVPLQPKKPWPVPDAYKDKKNPVASDAASIAAGKELWNTHCKSCHGAKGLGDGSKAPQLKTEPGDFTKPDVQAQTDGSLFYKISEGREDMPSFKKKIPDQEDIWNLVVFVRTFRK
ncbi:MAG TPA: c-type cytochrome [Puia sp.]|uniref:c-type cytochrome n=1 Tax=Puia sp. TaxID=2045100 RepID=UPI002D1DFF1B|nr:c-type cytochrome [Puia sp.]HVU93576.1 c-type cytochrome [Puia sp.]